MGGHGQELDIIVSPHGKLGSSGLAGWKVSKIEEVEDSSAGEKKIKLGWRV